MDEDNGDDGLCGVGEGQEGAEESVCACVRVCVYFSAMKKLILPRTTALTDPLCWVKSKKDKCCVTPLIPPTCKSEVAKFIDAKGRKPFRGSKGM